MAKGVPRGARPTCRQCGARLRARQTADHCDPCRRRAAASASDPLARLDPGFYARPEVRAALAAYDLGAVFRALRVELGMTQSQLSHLLDMDQARVSAIERGARHVRDIAVVARIASVLHIPPTTLGFSGATVGGEHGEVAAHGELEGTMLRREFTNYMTLFSLGAVAGLDTEWLKALVADEPTGTRHVGLTDVTRIIDSAQRWSAEDFARGSGAVRDAALAQLQAVLPLLDADMPADVRPQLVTAVAELASMTAYMSYDVGRHDAARRLWLAALRLAREADAHDLMVHIHYDLAAQATHLQEPDTALRHTQIGHAVAAGGMVSPATRCCLWLIQAKAHAARGDAAASDRARAQAVEEFGRVQPDAIPRWSPQICQSEAALAGHQGQTLYLLARARRDRKIADAAVQKLIPGTVYPDASYTKLRAMRLPELAGAHVLAGDLDTALTVGHRAADAATRVSSQVVTARLRTLDSVLATVPHHPGVTELRHRLTATAA